VSKSILGTNSPILGLATSYQEQIECHLRVASLLVCLAVGIMSLVGRIIFSCPWPNRNPEQAKHGNMEIQRNGPEIPPSFMRQN
jgi:hypothetical protein